MKSKMFEYTSKDKPFLKKDIRMRCLFIGLFTLSLILEIAALISQGVRGELTNATLIVGIVLAVLMLVFVLICLLYLSKSLTAIREIAREGKSVSSVVLLMDIKKNSFIRLYAVIAKVIALVMSMVLISAITYTILQIVYLSTITFYVPALFFVCICGFNSVYHIEYEIQNVSNLEEYNRAY